MNIKQETQFWAFNVFGQTSQTVTFVKGGLERYLMAKVKIKILFKITVVAKVVFWINSL